MRTLLSLLAVATAIGLTFLDTLPAAAPVASITPTVAQPVSCPCGEVCKCDELTAENSRLNQEIATLEATIRDLRTVQAKLASAPIAQPRAVAAPRAVSCTNGQCSIQQSSGLFGGRFRRGR